MHTKKNFYFRTVLFSLLVIFSLLLASCGEDEYDSIDQPVSEQPTAALPAADSIVGTWGDESGNFTYTEDGKLLVNGEDTGQTYVYQDNSLTENYADGSTQTYKVQLNGNEMILTSEDDGSVYALKRTDSPVAEAPASGGGSATDGTVDTGFRPNVDGFSLENYGDEISDPQTGETLPVTNLTSVEMRRMFGDAVCAAQPQSDGSCVLTPPADQWMEQNNSSMSGGHCEGFAVLSQLIYDGRVDANPFGAARTFDLQIPGNEPLQREIAYWWATQGPVAAQNLRLAPKDAVAYLEKEYSANPKNMISVGIYKEDGTGGHAITAYGVQDKGNGIYWIMVYDNNYPGQERHMTLDVNANTWEYEATINPTVDPDLYKGNPENPIEFTPDQSRLTVFPCDFCSGADNASKGGNILAAAVQQFNEIWTEGYINVELEDDQGRKIGYDENGKLVKEISEANLRSLRNGTLSEVSPVIEMPVGMNFTAYLWGDDKAAEIPASLVMIGKGFYIGIDDLQMVPGQEDQLYVDGEGDVINYTTDAEESPDIIVGIEKPGADFELVLKAVQVSKGTDISVVFDQKEDVFAFQITSDAPAQFSISITRIDANGDEETFDTGTDYIEVDPEKLMYFYFGKWEGQGSNLEIGYDENGNGEIEDSEISNMADAQ